MNRRIALSILSTTAALWLPAAHAQTKEINFGIISTESSANLKIAWQPLLDDMQKVTGLKVNPFFAPDYAGVIEGMRFNKVQVAWMGNKSGAEAVDRANGEVFARVTQADGAPGYWSLMIVHKDSPLKNARRRAEEPQGGHARLRRAELDERQHRARLLRVRAEQGRPDEGLQAHRAREPRDPHPCDRRQADRRGDRRERRASTA